MSINKRVFGSDIPNNVKKVLEARQILAGKETLPNEEIKSAFSDLLFDPQDRGHGLYNAQYQDLLDFNFMGQADLSSRTPFVRMWVGLDLVQTKIKEGAKGYQTLEDYVIDNPSQLDATAEEKQVAWNNFILGGQKEYYHKDSIDFVKVNGKPRIYQIGNNIGNQEDYFNELNTSIDQPYSSAIEAATLPREFDTNRNEFFRPTTGIINLQSDTLGALGLLKETKVTFQVGNFEDYDKIYSRYFLRPGARVFVDFGWDTSDLYDPQNLLDGICPDYNEETQITHQDDLEACLYGEKTYHHDPDNASKVVTKGFDGYVTRTNGGLETLHGIVSDYNARINSDGTVTCELTIKSSNSGLANQTSREIGEESRANRIETILNTTVLYNGLFLRLGLHTAVKKGLKDHYTTQFRKSDMKELMNLKKIGFASNTSRIRIEELRKSLLNRMGIIDDAGHIPGPRTVDTFNFKTSLAKGLSDDSIASGVAISTIRDTEDIYISIGHLEDFVLNPEFGFGTDTTNNQDDIAKKNFEVVFDSSMSWTSYIPAIIERQKAVLANAGGRMSEEKPLFLIPEWWGTSSHQTAITHDKITEKWVEDRGHYHVDFAHSHTFDVDGIYGYDHPLLDAWQDDAMFPSNAAANEMIISSPRSDVYYNMDRYVSGYGTGLGDYGAIGSGLDTGVTWRGYDEELGDIDILRAHKLPHLLERNADAQFEEDVNPTPLSTGERLPMYWTDMHPEGGSQGVLPSHHHDYLDDFITSAPNTVIYSNTDWHRVAQYSNIGSGGLESCASYCMRLGGECSSHDQGMCKYKEGLGGDGSVKGVEGGQHLEIHNLPVADESNQFQIEWNGVFQAILGDVATDMDAILYDPNALNNSFYHQYGTFQNGWEYGTSLVNNQRNILEMWGQTDAGTCGAPIIGTFDTQLNNWGHKLDYWLTQGYNAYPGWRRYTFYQKDSGMWSSPDDISYIMTNDNLAKHDYSSTDILHPYCCCTTYSGGKRIGSILAHVEGPHKGRCAYHYSYSQDPAYDYVNDNQESCESFCWEINNEQVCGMWLEGSDTGNVHSRKQYACKDAGSTTQVHDDKTISEICESWYGELLDEGNVMYAVPNGCNGRIQVDAHQKVYFTGFDCKVDARITAFRFPEMVGRATATIEDFSSGPAHRRQSRHKHLFGVPSDYQTMSFNLHEDPDNPDYQIPEDGKITQTNVQLMGTHKHNYYEIHTEYVVDPIPLSSYDSKISRKINPDGRMAFLQEFYTEEQIKKMSDFNNETLENQYDIVDYKQSDIDQAANRMPVRELFIKASLIKEHLTSEENLVQGLQNMFDQINAESHDTFKFMVTSAGGDDTKLAITDLNMPALKLSQEKRFNRYRGQSEDEYDRLFEFKIRSKNTIVQNYDINFNLGSGAIGNMMAIRGMSAGDQTIPIGSILDQTLALEAIESFEEIQGDSDILGKTDAFNVKYLPSFGDNQFSQIHSRVKDTFYIDRGFTRVGSLLADEVRFGKDDQWSKVNTGDAQDLNDILTASEDELRHNAGTYLSPNVMKWKNQPSATQGSTEDAEAVVWMSSEKTIWQDPESEGFGDYKQAFSKIDKGQLRYGKYLPQNEEEKHYNSLYNRANERLNGFVTIGDLSDYYLASVMENYNMDKDSLLPLTLNVTIYGISSLLPGDIFKVDYLPERYKNNVYFQVMRISHSVDKGGWKTTLETQWRLRAEAKKEASIYKTSELVIDPSVLESSGLPTRLTMGMHNITRLPYIDAWTDTPSELIATRQSDQFSDSKENPSAAYIYSTAATEQHQSLNLMKRGPIQLENVYKFKWKRWDGQPESEYYAGVIPWLFPTIVVGFWHGLVDQWYGGDSITKSTLQMNKSPGLWSDNANWGAGFEDAFIEIGNMWDEAYAENDGALDVTMGFLENYGHTLRGAFTDEGSRKIKGYMSAENYFTKNVTHIYDQEQFTDMAYSNILEDAARNKDYYKFVGYHITHGDFLKKGQPGMGYIDEQPVSSLHMAYHDFVTYWIAHDVTVEDGTTFSPAVIDPTSSNTKASGYSMGPYTWGVNNILYPNGFSFRDNRKDSEELKNLIDEYMNKASQSEYTDEWNQRITEAKALLSTIITKETFNLSGKMGESQEAQTEDFYYDGYGSTWNPGGEENRSNVMRIAHYLKLYEGETYYLLYHPGNNEEGILDYLIVPEAVWENTIARQFCLWLVGRWMAYQDKNSPTFITSPELNWLNDIRNIYSGRKAYFDYAAAEERAKAAYNDPDNLFGWDWDPFHEY